jgi:hypothetical protein
MEDALLPHSSVIRAVEFLSPSIFFVILAGYDWLSEVSTHRMREEDCGVVVRRKPIEEPQPIGRPIPTFETVRSRDWSDGALEIGSNLLG